MSASDFMYFTLGFIFYKYHDSGTWFSTKKPERRAKVKKSLQKTATNALFLTLQRKEILQE